MAPPSQSTPRRRRALSPAEDTIVVDTTPQALRTTKATKNAPKASRTPNTRTPNIRTPNTQKRWIDFKSLHNYGFQGPPPTSLKSGPPVKKARATSPEKTQNHMKESS